jgi:hypothetical protein
MKTITKDLGIAAIISFIIVLPLAILEGVNNTITRENVSGLILLFGVMWLLPTAFIVILMSMMRKAGNTHMSKPMILLLRVASLVLIATVWVWGIIDQLPCFLGVPNCD